MRRRMMMQGKNEDTYEDALYIENTSDAYIDTGFVGNQDTRFVLDFTYMGYQKVGSESFIALFGAGNRNNNNAYLVLINSTGLREQPQYRGTYESSTGTFVVGRRNTVDFDKNVFYGISSTKTFTYNTFTCPAALQILHVYNRTFSRAKVKIYSCKIYDNGTLVRDFVPKRKNGTTYGLWDNVNSIFKTSPNGVQFSGELANNEEI